MTSRFRATRWSACGYQGEVFAFSCDTSSTYSFSFSSHSCLVRTERSSETHARWTSKGVVFSARKRLRARFRIRNGFRGKERRRKSRCGIGPGAGFPRDRTDDDDNDKSAFQLTIAELLVQVDLRRSQS